MNEWNLLREKKPKDTKVVFVAFRGKHGRSVDLCMYTPSYIVEWCREDEGQWKGMSSTECESAWAWTESTPKYPAELEES